MSRGVDLDVTAIRPAHDPEALLSLVDCALDAIGFEKLPSIEALRLDFLTEWLKEGDRCVALTQTRNGWQYLYDTTFSTAELANAVSAGLRDTLVLQFNLQEETDFTFRVVKGGTALMEFSRGAEHFGWTGAAGKASSWDATRAETIAGVLGASAKALAAPLEKIKAGQKGERVGKGPRVRYVGGVQDGVQEFAAALGMPHLYRFFEGWMKSDLDWEEDEVNTVRAYRRRGS
ncbi:MAG TPA: hypothetical protein VEJ63_20300 [Planctomycetota bacterium]|nr:hypothetical protein [Planctomycetota bacterium]